MSLSTLLHQEQQQDSFSGFQPIVVKNIYFAVVEHGRNLVPNLVPMYEARLFARHPYLEALVR